MNPSRRYTLRDEDVAFIRDLLDAHREQMWAQFQATHDYTRDDLRRARLTRIRIRRALHIEEVIE